MEITKEQILKLDKGYTTVRELFPSVFELEVGKWYTPLNDYEGDCVFCVTCPSNLVSIGYGVNFKGQWKDNYNVLGMANHRLATKEEIETALINEAKERGFKEGVKYKNTNGDIRIAKHNPKRHLLYNGTLSLALGDGDGLIFENGKWAQIIEEEIIEVNGKKYKLID